MIESAIGEMCKVTVAFTAQKKTVCDLGSEQNKEIK